MIQCGPHYSLLPFVNVLASIGWQQPQEKAWAFCCYCMKTRFDNHDTFKISLHIKPDIVVYIMCLVEKTHPHMHGSNQLFSQISRNANLPHNIHGLLIKKERRRINATCIMVSFKKHNICQGTYLSLLFFLMVFSVTYTTCFYKGELTNAPMVIPPLYKTVGNNESNDLATTSITLSIVYQICKGSQLNVYEELAWLHKVFHLDSKAKTHPL